MRLKRNLQPLRGPLDLTSLVNVILLLLLFFVLSNAFVLQPGIPIDPPRSIFGTGAQANRYIVTVLLQPERRDSTGRTMPREASIFFNDHLMTLDELDVAFSKLPKQRGASSIVVRADKAVSYDIVMQICNAAIAHELGVVLATQKG
jgi:biopolymer transport protein ExbD